MQQYNMESITRNIGKNIITKKDIKKLLSSDQWILNDISIERIERIDNIIHVWNDDNTEMFYNLDECTSPMHSCKVNWNRLKPAFEVHPDFNPNNFKTEYSV